MAHPVVRTLDPRSLKALAHPLRVRILGSLRRDGPATATTLGTRLGESSGATSYHLRVLESHGFVREETSRGTGRERWWRAAQDMTSWRPSDVGGDPDARAAEQWLSGFHARTAMELVDRWLARRPEADPDWVDAAEQNDYLLEVTPAELRALLVELHDVVTRHVEAGRGRSEDPAAGRVRLLLHAVPEDGTGA